MCVLCSRSAWEELFASPESARAVLHRLQGEVLPALSHVTSSLRAKASRLAHSAADGFAAYVHAIEEQVQKVAHAAASDQPLPALKELMAHVSSGL